MGESIVDMLVVSDMDGTLLRADKTLPASTLQTIRLFTAMGGKFAIATGRTSASVTMYPQLAQVLGPSITCGGAVLFNFIKNEPAQISRLSPLAAKQALRDVMAHFPDVGVMICADDMRLYQVVAAAALQGLIRDEQMTYFDRPIEDLPEGWVKVLFAAPEKRLEELRAFLDGRTYPGVYFVSSDPHYLEMMPKGVSKGSALHQLCDMLGVPLKNTYVIGDYYNDVDMLKQAGHPVVVENAPQDVKALAERVIADNENAGVGQFLYELIRKYEK